MKISADVIALKIIHLFYRLCNLTTINKFVGIEKHVHVNTNVLLELTPSNKHSNIDASSWQRIIILCWFKSIKKNSLHFFVYTIYLPCGIIHNLIVLCDVYETNFCFFGIPKVKKKYKRLQNTHEFHKEDLATRKERKVENFIVSSVIRDI